MSREDIPDWKDMPEDISISTLCWQDICTFAYNELERVPTQQEVKELFETITDRMTDVMGENFSDSLCIITDVAIEEMLKSKPYNQDRLTGDELTSKKYCHECEEIQDTYWELNFCDKNPQGIDVPTIQHGNDDTCEDGYCNPESFTVESKHITKQYVKEHAIFERCTQCHQYFDSATPNQETPQKTSSN